MTFKTISAMRAFGGDIKKNVYFHSGKIRLHGRETFQYLHNFPGCASFGGDGKKRVHLQRRTICLIGRVHFQHLQTFSRCARLGAMLRYSKTKFLGCDLDEEIDFQSLTCALIFQTKLLGGDLEEKIDFQSVNVFKFIIQTILSFGIEELT